MRAPTEAVDIRTIRKSMRCFWCGLLGMIPGFGIGLAGFALKQFQEVALRSNESTQQIAFPFSLFAIALAANPILQAGIGWPAALLFALAMIALHWLSLARQFATTGSVQWNPGRAWAWSGAALASSGIFLSMALLEMFYASVFDEKLLGLR